MKERRTPPPTLAAPLKKHLGDQRGAKAALCEKLDISQAVLTNWLRRGVPRGRLPEVAEYMGISTDDYLEQAGERKARKEGKVREDLSQTDTDLGLLADLTKKWNSLPRGTKLAIAAIAKDVASVVENQTNETLKRYGATHERASDRSVEKNYGHPKGKS